MSTILDLFYRLSSPQCLMGMCVHHFLTVYDVKKTALIMLIVDIWEKSSELTASTRPFRVGVFSMRASNTSSASLRTYSKTAKAEKYGQLWSLMHKLQAQFS